MSSFREFTLILMHVISSRNISKNRIVYQRSSGGHTYVANNDSAFTLAYAVIMLNVDQVGDFPLL
jgi:Sec7-like guanine-nucleotide exchange factor